MAFAKKKTSSTTGKAKRLAAQAAAKAKTKAANKAKATEKAKDTAMIKTLRPVAKEINVRLDKAAKADGLSVDHRLAASLLMADAKAKLDASGIRFKTWCESNINHSYNTMRELAAIGASEDPYLALTDRRSAAKKRAQASRDAKANTPAITGAIASKPVAAPRSDFEQATEIVSRLTDKASLNLATNVARASGMKVVSDSDAAQLKDFRAQAKKGPGLGAVKAAFDALKASEKMELAEYAAAKVGVELVKPTFDDPLALPKGLDRRTAKDKVKRGVSK